MKSMFVNVPVTDLDRAKAFYTAVGFTINPKFTDHNAACVVVEDGHSYFMILVRDYLQTITRDRGARRITPAACNSLSRVARMLLGIRGRPAASSP